MTEEVEGRDRHFILEGVTDTEAYRYPGAGGDGRPQIPIRERAEAQGIEVARGELIFPERTVLLARASLEQMQRSMVTLNSIAELRRGKELADGTAATLRGSSEPRAATEVRCTAISGVEPQRISRAGASLPSTPREAGGRPAPGWNDTTGQPGKLWSSASGHRKSRWTSVPK